MAVASRLARTVPASCWARLVRPQAIVVSKIARSLGTIHMGAKRLSGFDNQMRDNETYENAQLGFRVLAPQGGVTLKRFVVDPVHHRIVFGGTATGAASSQVQLEFFVPIRPAPHNQGAAYISSGDLNVSLDGTGSRSFFHEVTRDIVFQGKGLINPLPSPIQDVIDETDSIVATTTSNTVNSTGTSEFSQSSTATLPGDFDLNGFVDGADFLIWQQGVGTPNAKYWQGDADFDGDVDTVDKGIWEDNFGQTP
jgi:hypothetical protein